MLSLLFVICNDSKGSFSRAVPFRYYMFSISPKSRVCCNIIFSSYLFLCIPYVCEGGGCISKNIGVVKHRAIMYVHSECVLYSYILGDILKKSRRYVGIPILMCILTCNMETGGVYCILLYITAFHSHI